MVSEPFQPSQSDSETPADQLCSDVKGWYLVCEYDPPGNVVGSFKENVEKAGDNNGQLGMGGAGVTGVSRVLMVAVGLSALAGLCL